ncbi:hypothetical protein FQN55_009548 [Onygenales sp. PD_40]|nr:hypothetical protein FQN55_009548 [Onygenales sp. PD_40]KAK2782641.1 hypothetical protein FQN53_009657 [Emmonsiellopsis sp. PD_33]KAK2800212.1 hypothetical protein FQN51_006288 [Onygenales sp. PD_10]
MAPLRTLGLVALSLFSSIAQGLPSHRLTSRAALLPSEDPFYVAPEGFEDTAPGTILRSRPTPAKIAAFGIAPANLEAAHQLLIRSSDNFGNPVAVVSTVLVPHGADYSKLVSYQFAEDASSPNCCPSYVMLEGSETGGDGGTSTSHAEFILIIAALEKGWVVTAPDHEGPTAAYLANLRAGYHTLDGIRGTLASGDITGVSSDATVVMWGYSGGSLASGFAAELQPSYAPELAIAGAALGGTVPNIKTALAAINEGDTAGLIPAGFLGLAHEYPEIKTLLDEQLIPEKREEFMMAEVECFGANVDRFKGMDVYTYLKDRDALENPTIDAILAENGMGQHTPAIPLLVYKAEKDEISWINDTTTLVRKYCDEGASVDYRISETGAHSDMAIVGAPDALLWIEDRMQHLPLPQEGCVTSTELTPLASAEALRVIGEVLVDLLLDLLHKPIGE